jgi:hypothetical protein
VMSAIERCRTAALGGHVEQSALPQMPITGPCAMAGRSPGRPPSR